MLKIFSAAVLATAMIAAPALAETAAKSTTQAPVIKAEQTKTKTENLPAKTDAKVTTKSDVKSETKAPANTVGQSKALDANAKVIHHKHIRHHRHHDTTSMKSDKMGKQHAQASVKKAG